MSQVKLCACRRNNARDCIDERYQRDVSIMIFRLDRDADDSCPCSCHDPDDQFDEDRLLAGGRIVSDRFACGWQCLACSSGMMPPEVRPPNNVIDDARDHGVAEGHGVVIYIWPDRAHTEEDHPPYDCPKGDPNCPENGDDFMCRSPDEIEDEQESSIECSGRHECDAACEFEDDQ